MNSRQLNIVIAAACFALPALLVTYLIYRQEAPQPTISKRTNPEQRKSKLANNSKQRRYSIEGGRVTDWWDEIPEIVRQVSHVTGTQSNIRRQDYSGPESCKACHKKNYESWSKHSHRWMNALATDETVKGDFSEDAYISHLGGKASFYRENKSFRMSLERDGVRREFNITQTIGSRFFQYYVGRQIKGPSPSQDPSYDQDHVLPYGYWLDPQEWVPVVHVYGRDDSPDDQSTDPFDLQSPPTFTSYSVNCNGCHTTFSFGDKLIRQLRVAGRHAPMQFHFAMPQYLAETHPELWSAERDPNDLTKYELLDLINTFEKYEASEHAVSLGVTCESCHLGSKEHAEGRLKKPLFFPQSPHLLVEKTAAQTLDFGRNHTNVNWACGRCHAGPRPHYAGGISTWNSTDFSDATRGGCYSELTCVHCHNPHQTIGKKWALTPAQDDALCLKCHKTYEPEAARVAHTHHPTGSAGSRCLNCHMPRITEGLQDMIRTHTIFSPTNPEMIEANHPNACNMCHVEKPIDWTLTHLSDWYGVTYDEAAIRRNYPTRKGPVALGWMKSDNKAVRLAAADGLFRNHAMSSLAELIDALDDPYLINRQFARIGIEKLLDIELKNYGYRFYMTAEERRKPLERLRTDWLQSD